jgi:hypothetical protein
MNRSRRTVAAGVATIGLAVGARPRTGTGHSDQGLGREPRHDPACHRHPDPERRGAAAAAGQAGNRRRRDRCVAPAHHPAAEADRCGRTLALGQPGPAACRGGRATTGCPATGWPRCRPAAGPDLRPGPVRTDYRGAPRTGNGPGQHDPSRQLTATVHHQSYSDRGANQLRAGRRPGRPRRWLSCVAGPPGGGC